MQAGRTWQHPAAAEATSILEAGNYTLLCFIPGPDGVPHVMKGMARGLVVTASTTAVAPEPTPTAMITLSDYRFDLSQPLKSSQNIVRVENAADQPHEVVVFKLLPGKTMKDFQAWLPVSDKQPPLASHQCRHEAGLTIAFSAERGAGRNRTDE